jgi:hypothetical protein
VAWTEAWVLVARLRPALRRSTVAWNVRERSFLPDWVGTTAAFTLSPSGGYHVQFQHEGLRPELECYDMCSVGWD